MGFEQTYSFFMNNLCLYLKGHPNYSGLTANSDMPEVIGSRI